MQGQELALNILESPFQFSLFGESEILQAHPEFSRNCLFLTEYTCHHASSTQFWKIPHILRNCYLKQCYVSLLRPNFVPL